MGGDLVLPPALEQALHLLFDVLDEQKTGVISITAIQQQPELSLPVSGLVDALAKVAQPGGQLTFDRFIAGVKIALIRSTNSPKGQHRLAHPDARNQENKLRHDTGHHRQLNTDGAVPDTYARQAGYRPDWRRADRLLLPDGPSNRQAGSHGVRDNDKQHGYRSGSDNEQIESQRSEKRNFKPMSGLDIPQSGNVTTDKERKGRFFGYTDAIDRLGDSDPGSRRNGVLDYERTRSGNQHTEDQRRTRDMAESYGVPGPAVQQGPGQGYTKRPSSNNREVRRHTLSSGVDYAMIKGMKLLEQEKDGLLQGLAVLEQAQGWFQAQLQGVEERQRSLGQQGAPNKQDHSVEAAQERLNFQASRIAEVCDRLQALMESSHRRFPSHMNLAMHQHPQRQEQMDRNIVSLLRSQNRMLSQEITEKSEKIAQLENEKAIIIRQMFEALAHNRNHTYDDTTFL